MKVLFWKSHIFKEALGYKFRSWLSFPPPTLKSFLRNEARIQLARVCFWWRWVLQHKQVIGRKHEILVTYFFHKMFIFQNKIFVCFHFYNFSRWNLILIFIRHNLLKKAKRVTLTLISYMQVLEEIMIFFIVHLRFEKVLLFCLALSVS